MSTAAATSGTREQAEPRPSVAWRARACSARRGPHRHRHGVLLIPLGVVTAFRARRLYSAVARRAARGSPRPLRHPGARRCRRDRSRVTQTIYISNHSSTLDLFVLVALGLPELPLLPQRLPAQVSSRSA